MLSSQAPATCQEGDSRVEALHPCLPSFLDLRAAAEFLSCLYLIMTATHDFHVSGRDVVTVNSLMTLKYKCIGDEI